MKNSLLFALVLILCQLRGTKHRQHISDPTRKIMLNGKEATGYRLNHEDIIKGGVLKQLYWSHNKMPDKNLSGI